MKRLTCLLVGAGLVLTACSAGSVSVADYAVAVEERAVIFGAESDDLRNQHMATLENTVARLQGEFDGEALIDAAIAEAAQESTRLFAGISDALDQYVRDLDAMTLPNAIADAHGTYVQALDTSRAGLASVLVDLPGATSFEDIDRIIAGSGFADAQQRVEVACHDLEGGIASLGPDVDLLCEATR
jgi:hypothetical protein